MSDPARRPGTPLLQQYFAAKDERPDVLLLMRVGDFYEAYGEDAEAIAAALNITLTARDDGGVRTPMAGVPHHAVERYLARLIRKGFRVAIMDQVEDPKKAKGLVRRRVTRVVSPGTVFEDSLLDSSANNFLAAAVVLCGVGGLAVADVSTGEFLAGEVAGDRLELRLAEEVSLARPAEILIMDTSSELASAIRAVCPAPMTPADCGVAGELTAARSAEELTRHFGTATLKGFGCEAMTAGIAAAAMILRYVKATRDGAAQHMTALGTFSRTGRLVLDPAARRNLELTAALGDDSRARSLLGVLDQTLTPMGGRWLRRQLEEPLTDVDAIVERLDGVEEFVTAAGLRQDLREGLRGVNDIERLVSRCTAGLASPRDLAGLRSSLEQLGPVGQILGQCSSRPARRIGSALLEASGVEPSIFEPLDGALCEPPTAYSHSPSRVLDLLRRALADEPPAGVRDGGVLRPGYHEELDSLRGLAADGRAWIAALETEERERTGIASLRVGYNSVFGYYLEVTRANIGKVPAHYIRKQTTAGGERYITPDLKEQEARVLSAHDRALDLEQELFGGLREAVGAGAVGLLGCARALAEIDGLSALAEAAVRGGYVRPAVDDGDTILIRAGRHPVVERIQGEGSFIPNDCLLDGDGNRLHIITGPNMAGKSTALRQVALIVLMAQCGSYVPAAEARIGVADRIFTRIGAHDDLSSGQSTFLVEMHETASILNNATERSLVILDEVGRGTSTYDGLSIAWAVAERLTEIGCRTLFATHYHHMNEMAKQNDGVKNYRVTVRESGDTILWLRRLAPGGTDRSYGVQVARMAGVPMEVIERAREVLRGLEEHGAGARGLIGRQETPVAARKRLQLSLFEAEPHPVVEELVALDVSRMTPIEALVRLEDLVQRAREEKP